MYEMLFAPEMSTTYMFDLSFAAERFEAAFKVLDNGWMLDAHNSPRRDAVFVCASRAAIRLVRWNRHVVV